MREKNFLSEPKQGVDSILNLKNSFIFPQLDIVTARVNKPILGQSKGQLVCLQQPSSSPFTNPWTETVLTEGPEVFFVLTSEFDSTNSTVQVFASQFFTNKLALYVFEKATFTLRYSRVLETDAPYDDAKIVDINADGKKELMVTTHAAKQGEFFFFFLGSAHYFSLCLFRRFIWFTLSFCLFVDLLIFERLIKK